MTKSFFRRFEYKPPVFEKLPIIHQDDDIIVLDKPAGLLTVAGKTQDLYDCLECRVQFFFPRATIVHRLDMSTSGIIIMALNMLAHRHLSSQFEHRKTKKTYIADVWGVVGEDQGVIDLPLRCDWENRPRQMVDFEHGRSAQTRWEVMKRAANQTRMALYPITGRSHQLRVHMQSLGHPILGDEFYAHDKAYFSSGRLHLHAKELEITHPFTLQNMMFKADCPF